MKSKTIRSYLIQRIAYYVLLCNKVQNMTVLYMYSHYKKKRMHTKFNFVDNVPKLLLLYTLFFCGSDECVLHLKLNAE